MILAVVGSLFLVQYLSMDHGHEHFSWVGAAVWGIVLAGLLTLAGLTWRGIRRGDRPQAR